MYTIATDPVLSHEKILNRVNLLANNNRVHWSCNQQPVFSRPDALQKLNKGAATKFVLNDQTWHQANWSKPGNLEQLLIQRAQDIRSQYDYVRVAYSGGVDSHAILTAFKTAGIAPDEIFFWTFLNQVPAKFSTNYEIHRSVVSCIPVLQKWFPSTKFTNLDFDMGQMETLRSLPSHLNNFSVYGSGIRTLPTALALCCFQNFGISNSITLTGADKPRVDLINGQWYSYFVDTACLDTWGQGVEGFYLGADPAIHIAQCHAIKNLIQQQGLTSRREILKFQNSKSPEIRNAINSALARPEPFDSIVTVGKKTTRFCANDPSESQPKVYLLNRALRTSQRGRAILNSWQDSKNNFVKHTGMDHNSSIFGSFYNLNNGESYTVDQLFPNGWNLD